MSPEKEATLLAAKNKLAAFMKQMCDEDPSLSAVDVLSLLAFMTGSAIAMQDQRKIDVNMAFAIVEMNLEAGNRAVVQQLLQSQGGRA